MLLSILYLALFICVGLLLARRAVPDGSAAVILPLGCGFGVSLLAVLPAVLALALGFTLPAVLLAAAHPCTAHGKRRVPHRAELLRRYADAPGVH